MAEVEQVDSTSHRISYNELWNACEKAYSKQPKDLLQQNCNNYWKGVITRFVLEEASQLEVSPNVQAAIYC